jgi:hypothetical protein
VRQDPEGPVGAWEELERRRVLRVAVAYVVAAFAVVQAAELWLPAVGAAGWMLRAVLGLAVLGFPVAVVLAWTYDLSPQGIEKTPEDATTDPTYAAGPRVLWAVFVLAASVIGALLWTVGR